VPPLANAGVSPRTFPERSRRRGGVGFSRLREKNRRDVVILRARRGRRQLARRCNSADSFYGGSLTAFPATRPALQRSRRGREKARPPLRGDVKMLSPSLVHP
jgi:hypothetical protein